MILSNLEDDFLYRRSQRPPAGLLVLISYSPLVVLAAVWYAFGVRGERLSVLVAAAVVMTVFFLEH